MHHWRLSGSIASGPYRGKWRVGNAIATLARQVDSTYGSSRDTGSDGTLGDTSHQNRESDHNPNEVYKGIRIVLAIDITEDDAAGASMDEMCEDLRLSRDPRIKYVIHAGRMFSSYATSAYPAWTWRPYSGPNGHFTHAHISLVADQPMFDSTAMWSIYPGGTMDGHPAQTHGEWIEHHKVVTEPDYIGVWQSYLDRGLSTVKASWAYGALRLDLAWLYNKAIRPLETRATRLEARVTDLEVANNAQAQTIAKLLNRVAQLEERAPSTGSGMTETQLLAIGDARWVRQGRHEITL